MNKIQTPEEFREALRDLVSYAKREQIAGIFSYYDTEETEVIEEHTGDILDRIFVFDVVSESHNEKTADALEKSRNEVQTLVHAN